MNGYAQLKSRILSRDEKAIGSITMPRAMLAGGAGGVVFMLLRTTPFASLAVPAFFAASIFFLWLFGTQQGLPRWRFFLTQAHSYITISAYLNPNGFTAQCCQLAHLDVERASIFGGEIFSGQAVTTISQEDISNWRIVDQPLASAQSGYSIRSDPGIVLK